MFWTELFWLLFTENRLASNRSTGPRLSSSLEGDYFSREELSWKLWIDMLERRSPGPAVCRLSSSRPSVFLTVAFSVLSAFCAIFAYIVFGLEIWALES